MKQSEAKELIRGIWLQQDDKCSKKNGYPLSFYFFIKNNHSDLLSFRFSGDKYQIVKAWVVEWQRAFC